MIAVVVAVQLLLPLLLLLWLALLPAKSGLGLALQVAGIGALLLALALVAQWAVVPWWLPRFYGGLWAVAALWHVLRGYATGAALLPAGVRGWSGLALSVVLLAGGGWYSAAALEGRAPPAAPIIGIANPFGAGRYLVGSGGGREIVNAHLRTLDSTIERYRPWRGQSYAIDFFGLNRWGTRATGPRPADPKEYAIFGAALHAPCAGEVLAIENERPDFKIPEQDPVSRLGNHVLLQCAEAVVVLAHLVGRGLDCAPIVVKDDQRGVCAVCYLDCPRLEVHAGGGDAGSG